MGIHLNNKAPRGVLKLEKLRSEYENY